MSPRCAALIRSAASLEIIRVGAYWAWPRAAPMMRLSGISGSSPCSISRCLIPLTCAWFPDRGVVLPFRSPAIRRLDDEVLRWCTCSRRSTDIIDAGFSIRPVPPHGEGITTSTGKVEQARGSAETVQHHCVVVLTVEPTETDVIRFSNDPRRR